MSSPRWEVRWRPKLTEEEKKKGKHPGHWFRVICYAEKDAERFADRNFRDPWKGLQHQFDCEIEKIQ
jgi:hypothetical protein